MAAGASTNGDVVVHRDEQHGISIEMQRVVATSNEQHVDTADIEIDVDESAHTAESANSEHLAAAGIIVGTGAAAGSRSPKGSKSKSGRDDSTSPGDGAAATTPGDDGGGRFSPGMLESSSGSTLQQVCTPNEVTPSADSEGRLTRVRIGHPREDTKDVKFVFHLFFAIQVGFCGISHLIIVCEIIRRTNGLSEHRGGAQRFLSPGTAVQQHATVTICFEGVVVYNQFIVGVCSTFRYAFVRVFVSSVCMKHTTRTHPEKLSPITTPSPHAPKIVPQNPPRC